MSPRHAFITGGSSGIGLALAQQLAAQGTRLSLFARDPTKLAHAALEITTRHPERPEICLQPGNVADETAVRTAITAAESAHGPIDLLITSAGLAEADYF
ncbi:MAG: SDR family NAD(P)-dependent oxidoreductase [Candidatus Synoicihabitans palmerolidicus]|nr:SDR family NAD(P)-dependent oxidoreductase [Candidatus Synoicihabitans palmerolidicus]